MEVTLKKTALNGIHRKLDAKLVEFGGWEMPLSYPSGTIAEHMAARTEAALFDVSHLGTVRLSGTKAFEILQRTLTNDLGKISPGKAQYTHLLDDASGSVLDDIIVWWTDKQTFDVMPNAANTERVQSALPGEDITEERALIALQGPKARTLIGPLIPEVQGLPHFGVTRSTYKGESILVAATGYTGEDGVELFTPNEVATPLWEELISLGAKPAGLGARDTLRLEAGLPLHGHELGEGITPLQAGLEWVVAFSKPEFRGRKALIAEKERGIGRKLVGLKGFTRQPLRAEQEIILDGTPVGFTTSGNYSPILNVGIAMGFVDTGCSPGDIVSAQSHGRSVSAEIVKLPFVKKTYAK